MHPFVEPVIFDIGEDRFILLGERRREIPRLHHHDVVFVVMYRGDHRGAAVVKAVVEEVVHQAEDTVSNGVRLIAVKPILDIRQKAQGVAVKGFEAHGIGQRPAVEIGEKALGFCYGSVKVFEIADDEAVELVLLEISMREYGDKVGRFFGIFQLLGELSQSGDPHADDRIGIDRGIELDGACLIAFVLQGKQPFLDIGHITALFSGNRARRWLPERRRSRR